jgi:hypothetical protein
MGKIAEFWEKYAVLMWKLLLVVGWWLEVGGWWLRGGIALTPLFNHYSRALYRCWAE